MSTKNGQPDNGNRVRNEWRCPQCGEDHVDSLVWIDDDRVRCDRCGTVYNPNEDDSPGD